MKTLINATCIILIIVVGTFLVTAWYMGDVVDRQAEETCKSVGEALCATK